MKKEQQLTTLALIKDEAVELELILEEKKRKSAIGTNEVNGNGRKPLLINLMHKNDTNQIEAIKGNNYRPYQNIQAQ
jgi:hypothetical protein